MIALVAIVLAASPLQLAQRAEGFYKKTKDFSAHFEQTTANAIFGPQKAAGVLEVKRPARMRWSYDKPVEKVLVIDGTRLTQYVPLDKRAQVNEHFSPGAVGAGVSFLWGEGSLEKDFTLAAGALKNPPAGTEALELTPKKPAAYQRVVLAVDKDGRVLASLLVDQTGNQDRLDFSDVKTNVGVPDARFKLVLPKDVAIETMR